MEDLYQDLESKIRALLSKCKQLEQLNLNLTQSKYLVQREKELLQTKNKAAISQIEDMVARLKSIESA